MYSILRSGNECQDTYLILYNSISVEIALALNCAGGPITYRITKYMKASYPTTTTSRSGIQT